MATLGLKEMGKFLWEGREKSLPSWLSHFSFNQYFNQARGKIMHTEKAKIVNPFWKFGVGSLCPFQSTQPITEEGALYLRLYKN